MDPSPTTTTPPANTGARVLLGIFILGQLFFLAATNFLGLFSEARDGSCRRTPPADRSSPG